MWHFLEICTVNETKNVFHLASTHCISLISSLIQSSQLGTFINISVSTISTYPIVLHILKRDIIQGGSTYVEFKLLRRKYTGITHRNLIKPNYHVSH